MEVFQFPYVVNGHARRLSVSVTNALVPIRPVVLALGLTWNVERKKLKLLGLLADGEPRLTLPGLQSWLDDLLPSEMITHFALNLRPMLEKHLAGSLDVIVAALNHVERPDVIIVGDYLNSVDYFRRDASLGAAKLQPEVIDTVARSGAIDLFVRPPRSVWDHSQADLQRVTVPLADGYRPGLLQAYRTANQEALTGPQMIDHYPDSPLIQRRLIPARSGVANGQVVTIDAHPQRFAWEP